MRAARSGTQDGPVELNRLAALAAERYANRPLSPKLVADCLRFAEWFVLTTMALVAAVAVEGRLDALQFWRYAVFSGAGAVAGIAAMEIFGAYDVHALRRGPSQFVLAAGGWAVAVTALAFCLVLIEPTTPMSTAWLPLWYGLGIASLFVVRLALARQVRRWSLAGRMERRAVIVGGGAAAETVIRSLAAQDADIRICGIFDDRAGRRSPSVVAGYPKLGNVRELVEFARRARIDMLIVTIPVSAQKRVLELLKSLWILPLDIRLVAPRSTTADAAGDAALPLVGVFDKPIGDWGRVGKRLFDVSVATAALILLAPVFVATAIAIKLDSRGPVFFRQKRHGFNNETIEVFKFRSMFHEMADPAARRVVTRGDARVTRVGRVIRKSSIDELPQLWNVIRGELSLVGPRPHAVRAYSSTNEAFHEIVDDYFGRHKVKPGITGWAQINGYRGEIDRPEKLKARFEHDLHYIDNWSLWLDIAILAKTPASLLGTENAY